MSKPRRVTFSIARPTWPVPFELREETLFERGRARLRRRAEFGDRSGGLQLYSEPLSQDRWHSFSLPRSRFSRCPFAVTIRCFSLSVIGPSGVASEHNRSAHDSDVEVLERHRKHVSPMQVAEGLLGWRQRGGSAATSLR